MKIRTLFTLLMGLICLPGISQVYQITGQVKDDTDKQNIAGATVELMRQSDSTLVQSTVTNDSGTFVFQGIAPDSLILAVTPSGYQQYVSFFILRNDRDMGEMLVSKQGTDLSVVTIVARPAPVTQRGDTAQYSASQFKVNPDANAEDLIKKMPGITVDRQGNVTAQGEQVRKVTVDGREFFGDDATAALKNLPAEVIDKIQVFDRLSDQAQFTGFDDGNSTRAINIVTKSQSRNGQFGRIYAGYGTDERYSAGGNVSFFNNNRRISLVGLFNNVNQQNFASEDLLGLTGSGGGGRGGQRGGGNFGRGAGNFMVGQQSGIATTNAFGINYSDQWFKKVEVSGSYFFNNSNLSNDRTSNGQYFLGDTTQFYDEVTLSDRDNFNHRINMRLEYKLDSNNSFIFSPNISFQNNDAIEDVSGVRYFAPGELLSRTLFNNSSSNSGYNMNNSLLWRHSFAKRGRTLSINLRQSINDRKGETYLTSINEFFGGGGVNDTIRQFTDLDTRSRTYSADFSYTEPVGKKGQLQFNYRPSVSKSESDQQVLQFDNIINKFSDFDTSLSNRFDNSTTRHETGVRYRVGDRDNMFSAGIDFQTSRLESDQLFPEQVKVDKSFNNFLPNLMWRKKLSPNANIRLFYRAGTDVPSINQLQNVINNNNPLFLRSGNPELEQDYSHRLSARYTYTNTKKGSSFFANVYLQQANNYITNATYIATADSLLSNDIILYRGAQLTKPVNLDGYLSMRTFLTYGQPVSFLKSNLNLNAGFNWSKVPGMVNNVEGETDNYTYSAGAVISSNISEYVDFNISYNANYSVVRTSLRQSLDDNYLNQQAGLQVNLLSKNGWFVQNDLTNQTYSGLSEGFNQSYWLWNAAIGKKFLKNNNGELKLSVFDLLKQNQSISRTVEANYIEDVQNQVLQQYFLLTFSYRLRNFGTPAKAANRQQGRVPGGPGF